MKISTKCVKALEMGILIYYKKYKEEVAEVKAKVNQKSGKARH